MPFRSSARSSILLTSGFLVPLCPHHPIAAKKDRGFRPRSKSGRKRPGTGSDSVSYRSLPISQIEKSGALTELNFAQPIINTLVDPTLLDGIDLTHEALDPA
jgi:hypothetical protein